MTDDVMLDATGLLCPLPVLKIRKRLQALSSGDLLTVRTDDPAAIIDIPHFCNETGHEIAQSNSDGGSAFWAIRKA